MTGFLNSKGMNREDVVAKIVLMREGGSGYTFDSAHNSAAASITLRH